MFYTVSIHKSHLKLLKSMSKIISVTELLAENFISCEIESEIPKEQFWEYWHLSIDK